MKLKIIFPVLLLLFQLMAFRTQAQNKVKRYCEVSSSDKFFYSGYAVDYGQNRKYNPLKDSVCIRKLQKVESLETRVEVLNYMSELGWDLVSLRGGKDYYLPFIFSREFDPAELNEKKQK